jgi:hypothetical protein
MSRSIDSRWSRTQKRYDRSQRVAKWTRSRYSDFASPYSRLAAYAPMDCQRQLQPAVRRFATWDRLKSRHSVKVTYPPAVLLPDRSTRAVVRSLCSASCKLQNPQLLDFGMMGIHKPSACAGNELWVSCTFGVVLLGGTGSARQPCARICALPYPLIDCDTYPSPQPSHRGLSHVAVEHSSLALGYQKSFLGSLLGSMLIERLDHSPALPDRASSLKALVILRTQ